jgi:hypothetical protein
MHFVPVILENIFDDEDTSKLENLIKTGVPSKNWIDPHNNRKVLKFQELDLYFSKKLEPLAKKIFNDDSLKSTYAVYLDYNKPTSRLPMHKDNNACTYTISYCMSAKTPWPLLVESEAYVVSSGYGIAFMGGYDSHGRPDMPDPETNRVEIIMFHFCPDDHWYFTEGPDYMYELMDAGLLPEGDSYYLSPKKLKHGIE